MILLDTIALIKNIKAYFFLFYNALCPGFLIAYFPLFLPTQYHEERKGCVLSLSYMIYIAYK